MSARNVYIVAAKRTPFGTFGGKLRDVSATQMAAHACRATLTAANVAPTEISSVNVGNVIQSSADAAYLSRHVGLMCGTPQSVPALTINRLCGSGFETIVQGWREILLGDSEIVLTAGVESMSQAPYSVRNVRWGTKLGQDLKLEDTLWAGLSDSYVKLPMALTAENLAEQHSITRLQCDELAIRSQTLWNEANEKGHFSAEIEPIAVRGKKGEEMFAHDEHPKPKSTLESIGRLPSIFKKNGTVTAANASGVCDGAASVLVASEEAVKRLNLKPLARLVSHHVVGVPPEIMGIGPVNAILGALKKASLSMDDMDLIEVNEAFAAQFLAVQKELKFNLDKANVCGGAIALGHPLGASGSRIMGHLAHALHRTNGKYAVGSACIGGGQGIAIVIERC